MAKVNSNGFVVINNYLVFNHGEDYYGYFMPLETPVPPYSKIPAEEWLKVESTWGGRKVLSTHAEKPSQEGILSLSEFLIVDGYAYKRKRPYHEEEQEREDIRNRRRR